MHSLANSPPLEALLAFLERHPRLFVLTGAGCSTESGIPDYRDADGAWKRKPPVTYQAFMTEPHVRHRYWARSFIGWRWFGRARPNGAHDALARLEADRDARVAILTSCLLTVLIQPYSSQADAAAKPGSQRS